MNFFWDPLEDTLSWGCKTSANKVYANVEEYGMSAKFIDSLTHDIIHTACNWAITTKHLEWNILSINEIFNSSSNIHLLFVVENICS